MVPKYQVFISSTYEDLKDEREQVVKAILKMGHIPIGMEMFNAGNETQWQMIKRRIEESDYYVVIIAQRYGSVEEESAISYTEKEYDYATSLDLPSLGFVLKKSAAWPANKRDDETKKQEALKEFVVKVEKKMRAGWSNKDDLALAVTTALSETVTAFPRTGWVRADQAVRGETLDEITRLSKENSDLREELLKWRQNARDAPMPVIEVTMDVVYGSGKWFEFKEGENNYSYVSPLLIEKVEKRERNSHWLYIDISNQGTLATDITIILNCKNPIVNATDVEAFKERHSFIMSPNPRASGWKEILYDEINQTCSMEGNIFNLKSGQDYKLIVPLVNDIQEQKFDSTQIELSMSPVTGRHFQKSYTIRELFKT